MFFGLYMIDEKFGFFLWCLGVLMIVVREGRWVLIEDLDCVLIEVMSMLLFFIECGEFLILGCGERI